MMVTAKLVAVLLIVLQCWNARSQMLTPQCNPSDFGNIDSDNRLPLPVVPGQYMLTAEVNLLERNRSIFVKEYFDEIGNRARIENTINGTMSVTIADYNGGEAFVFPDRDAGRACSVYPIVLNSRNIFLVSRVLGVVAGENHTVHIAPPFNNFQSRINSSNTNYTGVELVRGIPSHHWQACYATGSEWFLADLYITYNDQWSLPFMSERSPVSIEVVGQRMDNGTLSDIRDTINYVSFQNGSDAVPDEVFQVPTGMPCRGRKAGKPLPPFPRFFSTRFELTVRNTIVTAKAFYDLDYKLIRVDSFVNSSSSHSPITGPISIVHDFNAGLQYMVSKRNFGQCIAQVLNQSNAAFDGTASDEDSLLHIQSARDLFLAGSQYNYSYEGVTTIRGVQVEGWSSIRDTVPSVRPGITFTNVLYEIFFTQPGTTHISDYSISSDPAVWRLALSGNFTGTRNGQNFSTSVNFVNDLSGYSSSEPPLDVFDVLSCYGPSDYVEVNFGLPITVPDPMSPPPIDLSRFHGNLRKAMMDYATLVGMPFVSPLQINAIRMRGFSTNLFRVSFHITNINSAAPRQWEFTPQQFADRLQRDLIANNMSQTIDLGIGAPVRPVAVSVPSSAPASIPSSTPTSIPTSTATSISSSGVAGIAIAFFFLGVLLSAVTSLAVCGVFIFCKRRSTQGSFDINKNAAVDYERHSDNMALSSPTDDKI